jgi:hypothetical protein
MVIATVTEELSVSLLRFVRRFTQHHGWREIGDIEGPGLGEQRTSFEGMLASCFTPFTSSSCPQMHPTVTSLSLVFAKICHHFRGGLLHRQKTDRRTGLNLVGSDVKCATS